MMYRERQNRRPIPPADCHEFNSRPPEKTQSQGAPLSSTLRADLEPRFGHDFSKIRVYSDSAADQVAQDFGARALTVGNDIYFAAGEYDSTSYEGRYLVAHELAHTVQQERSAVDGSRRSAFATSPSAESEAEAAGAHAAVGNHVAISASTPVGAALGPKGHKAPDPSKKAKTDPKQNEEPLFPLPLVPEQAMSPDFALERAKHWADLGTERNARIYEAEALGTPDINQDYASFTAAADLAATALADHLHLQRSLGFTDTRDLGKGLTKSQRERVAEDLDVADVTIEKRQQFLQNSVNKALASQEKFVGAGRLLSAYLSGNAMGEIDRKIGETTQERREIEEKIKHAGEIGSKVQSAIMIGLSVVTLNPEELGGGLVHTGHMGELAIGEPGLLGGLIEDMAAAKYNAKLAELDKILTGLSGLAAGVTQTKNDQTYQGLVSAFKGALDELKANVQDCALQARELRDIMRTPPKKQAQRGTQHGKHPSAEEAAAAADAKDPAKRVEIFVTSAMATNALLDGGITAANRTLDKLRPRLGVYLTERPDYDVADDPRFPLSKQEPHGRDVDQLLAMETFVGKWIMDATTLKTTVQAEADQAKTLRSGAE